MTDMEIYTVLIVALAALCLALAFSPPARGDNL